MVTVAPLFPHLVPVMAVSNVANQTITKRLPNSKTKLYLEREKSTIIIEETNNTYSDLYSCMEATHKLRDSYSSKSAVSSKHTLHTLAVTGVLMVQIEGFLKA